MTRARLLHLLSTATDEQLAREIRAAVICSIARRDPLAVHILQSRESMREADRRATGKTAKPYREVADQTYERAKALGYSGTPGAWYYLLRNGIFVERTGREG